MSSKIFKFEEVDSQPSNPEKGVMYLVRRFSGAFQRRLKALRYYNGSAWVEVNGSSWLGGDTSAGTTSSLPSVDISNLSDAKEFLAVVSFYASRTYWTSVEVVIPNAQVGSMADNRQDYMTGYYYDASYNASILVRLNLSNYTISVVSGFTKITGNADDDTVKLTVFAR